MADEDKVAEALRNCLLATYEADGDFEPANVTDALFAIARAIEKLAREVRDGCTLVGEALGALNVEDE